MKNMMLGIGIFIFMIILLLLMSISGGEATQPVVTFASEEMAEAYQYIGSELGVPWDIIMLSDGIFAEQEGLGGIEDRNPLITSLEFCILQEDLYLLHIEKGKDEEGNDIDIKKWVLEETKLYTAADTILIYIGKSRDKITYNDAAMLVSDINAAATKKLTEDRKYVATLRGNPDYNLVLRDYIKLEESYITGVMDLHESKYLSYLYGYIEDDINVGDITLPPVTTGNVSRMELARVAVSLIDWPYLMGGKSSVKGLPAGALDCSGFVDWVYIQCFGKGISAGGNLPSGVAIAGTAIQYYACSPIAENDLQIGDLGFLRDPATLDPGKVNHVGIYIGELNGKHCWVHCAGRAYGYEARPKGRVGISLSSGSNSQDPITGGTFTPPMKSCNFTLYRRPNYEFKD